MKKATILIPLLLLFFSSPSFAQNNNKISLTQDQLVNGLPEGIIKPIPTPVAWIDNNTVQLLEMENGKRVSYLYDIKKGSKTPYTPTVVRRETPRIDIPDAVNPTHSPDSAYVAYTKDNDLYVMDLASGKEKRLTFDGSELILNGYASWVYYEEILGRGSRYRSFWWSPDSKTIAFYRFDNTNVPMFPIYEASGQQGTLSRTRYPKAGEDNPTVKVGMINITEAGSKVIWADFNEKQDQYFGIPYWSANSKLFIVPWMPRDQNEMILYKIVPETGVKESIYTEKQATWIDWLKVVRFTDQGFYMVRDFELWEHIYYLSYDGSKYEKITDGKNWGINIEKVDEKKGEIFYSARRENSARKDLYRVNLKNKKTDRLSFGEYSFGAILISPDSKNYIATYSNTQTPTQLALVSISSKPKITVLGDSKGEKFDSYKLAIPEIHFITTDDGFTLPATITWPVDLDPSKKYPVLVRMYGGPNSTQVMDTWRNPGYGNQWWAYEGVIQISVDNRASGHCGKEGINQIFRNLGEVELNDFIDWVKYLRKRPFVDKDKVGITGFSYGGTMTVLALTDGNEYFKYGIAGGGVYDWRLYDSHYTERYMDTPQDNKEGYDRSAVINKAKKYIGDETSMLRITHGTSDDNVHYQNTLQMIDALQKEGKIFELMLYPGAFHGYRGYQGTHSSKEDLIFWYKYLLNSTPPSILMK